MEVGVQIQQRLAQRKVEQLCLFCRSPYRLDTLAGGRCRAQPGDALNGVKHGNIIEVLAHQALIRLVRQEQVLQKYRLTIGGAQTLDIDEQGFRAYMEEGFLILTHRHDLTVQQPGARHHAVLLAGLRKAGSSSAAGKLAMDAGLADKGAPPLHFDQIPFGAQLFHRTAHRDAADRVLRTQFRLRGDLLVGFVLAALDRGTNVILYLLVKRDDSTIIDRHEIPHPQIEYIVINIIFILWL